VVVPVVVPPEVVVPVVVPPEVVVPVEVPSPLVPVLVPFAVLSSEQPRVARQPARKKGVRRRGRRVSRGAIFMTKEVFERSKRGSTHVNG